MTLKDYVVVNHGDAGVALWNREQWITHLAEARTNSPGYDPPIITTFNADEQLTEPGQPVPAGEWISVEDEMPRHNIGVLVFIPGEDNHITSGMWDRENVWVLLDEYRCPETEVTHWRPLPAPPSPKQGDKQ